MTDDLHADAAVLTSHVLDTALGRPGNGVQIDLLRLDADGTVALGSAITNQDGRCEKPLLTKANTQPGRYRLDFHIGSYFSGNHFPGSDGVGFYDVVPVEFAITDPDGHYHVPLVASAWGYSTYRGVPPAHPPRDNANVLPVRERCESIVAAQEGPGGGAGITTHVIDVAQGCGASDLEIDVFWLDDSSGKPLLIGREVTAEEGRTAAWLVPAGQSRVGSYELVFHLGEYYTGCPVPTPSTAFFETARVRFRVHDRDAHHHVPLLASPWGYTTYRGS